MPKPFPTDKDIAAMFPEIPSEVTCRVTTKQYAIYRAMLIRVVTDMREVLMPLNEEGVCEVVEGLRESLATFLDMKLMANDPVARRKLMGLVGRMTESVETAPPPVIVTGASAPGDPDAPPVPPPNPPAE